MTPEELKAAITNLLPQAQLEEGGEWLNVFIAPGELLQSATLLRENPDLYFDYLFCLTAVDFKTHLTMVYHLSSTRFRHTIVLKAKLDSQKQEIETVCPIWRSAEMLEREVYEMFGVNFLNHPDLRLLILPDGWEGKNPLRKDFEDPVNMIKL